jgi:hypothetical protein
MFPSSLLVCSKVFPLGKNDQAPSFAVHLVQSKNESANSVAFMTPTALFVIALSKCEGIIDRLRASALSQ